MSDDGKREILPEEVTVESSQKARKIVHIPDTYHIPPAMAKLSQGADLMVHAALDLGRSRESVSGTGAWPR